MPKPRGINYIESNYLSPVATKESIYISSIENTLILNKTTAVSSSFDLNFSQQIIITLPNGEEKVLANNISNSATFIPTLSGIYSLRYNGRLSTSVAGGFPFSEPYSVRFDFIAIQNQVPPPKYTITDVINRLFNLAEQHLVSFSPPYAVPFKLDAAQAEAFGKILAPEFAFTKMTLKETLDLIGGYIHGIPRLVMGESGKFDTVRFDMLGGTERAALGDLNKYKYIGKGNSFNAEQYATEIDSTVDNLVNTLNAGEGAVIEPYFNAYKTVRSEQAYARITDGNMVIETTLPIYSVEELRVLDPDGKAADITDYVFEGSDYGRLSSYDGVYPYSKAHAIYYEKGQRNIKGLSYKSPNAINAALSNYAITNIIKNTTGTDISPDWWSDKGDNTGNYPKLAFRITYTPIFSARVLQHKPFHEMGEPKTTLAYNQGSNLVETRFYGENMKGAIARMGNPEKSYRFRESDLSLIPKAGQMWDDDHYITAVAVEMHAPCYYVDIWLSKDYNRLSQYIGINSEWRAYEVSEQMAYERHSVFTDYGVIGGESYDNHGTWVTTAAAQQVARTFIAHDGTRDVISLASVYSWVDNTLQAQVTVPVVSSSFGNSMLFVFGMADNYSAGVKSDYWSGTDISGYWQTDVPYTDYFGRVDYAFVGLYGVAHNYQTEWGFDYPQGGYTDNLPATFATSSYWHVDKNGGEVWKPEYAVQYVTTWQGLIIGSALSRNCSLVNASKFGNTALFVLPDILGKFDNNIDLTKATKIHEYTEIGGYGAPLWVTGTEIRFSNWQSTVDGKAWAIADVSNGEILFARNIPVVATGTIELPTISFTHKLP